MITPPELKVGIYEHYKGEHYLVLGIARLDLADPEWDDELAVVYMRLYRRDGAPMSVRPLRNFLEPVETGIPRFRYLGVEESREDE